MGVSNTLLWVVIDEAFALVLVSVGVLVLVGIQCFLAQGLFAGSQGVGVLADTCGIQIIQLLQVMIASHA